MTAPVPARLVPSSDGRWRIVTVVVVALVVALAVQAITSTDGQPDADAETAAMIPPADAVSSAWYCAAGSSAPDGLGDEVLFVTNLSERAARAEVSVMPGSTEPVATTPVELAPRTQTRIRVADVLATAEPGVLVEAFGGRVVVEHGISGSGDLAVGACATRAATSWHFGAGTTDPDAQLWLALFNPFGDDAIVDLSFLTDTGFEVPGDTQGLVVPRRSRVTLAIHDLVRRQPVVATQVEARSGRIVAEQVQQRVVEPTGLALSLGVIEPTSRVFFPSIPFEGASVVSIANPGAAPARVPVRTHLDGDATLAPEIAVVPSRSVSAVDVAARVPVGLGSWVEVDARDRFVAEQLLAVDGTGFAYVAGIAVTARSWALAEARTDAESRDLVIAVNPSPRSARVTLEVISGGERTTARTVTIEAGRRALFDLDELDVPVGSGLVVRSSRPIAVARESIGSAGFTATPAIPEGASGS